LHNCAFLDKDADSDIIFLEELNFTKEEVLAMKRIIVLVAVVGVVVAFGSAFAFAEESMINYLDPSNAPVVKATEATGLMGLPEGGSGAGGRGENPESFINYLDPSNAPASRVVKGPAAAITRDDPDGFIHTIDPSQ
jgi:hypothetical protein